MIHRKLALSASLESYFLGLSDKATLSLGGMFFGFLYIANRLAVEQEN